MINKDWPELKDEVPYAASLPKHSNGFVQVVDKNGEEIAGCYGSGAARHATLIAAALNRAAEDET